jgi:hypothetical protein
VLTCSDDLRAAGGISSTQTVPWRMNVPCTTIQGFAATTGTVAMKKPVSPKTAESFAVGGGLRLAARSARKTVRAYGRPLYIWENGKVVAKKSWRGHLAEVM